MTFDIDANGIVSVQAKDKATGKEQQIRIQASGGLSDADIEKMVREAEANATADKARREMVETRNSAEGLIHQVERNLKEHGEKLPPADKAEAEAAIEAVRAKLDGTDAEGLKSASDALEAAAMKIGQAVYAQSAASPGGAAAGPGAPEAGGADNVVDADFEDVEDKKKSA